MGFTILIKLFQHFFFFLQSLVVQADLKPDNDPDLNLVPSHYITITTCIRYITACYLLLFYSRRLQHRLILLIHSKIALYFGKKKFMCLFFAGCNKIVYFSEYIGECNLPGIGGKQGVLLLKRCKNMHPVERIQWA